MRIPLSTLRLSMREMALATEAVNTGWISGTGPHIRDFELALAPRIGRQHVIAVNSGTSALELALAALDIGPGDEVIVPALTFVSPAAAVRSARATVVLCDIEPDSWTIDVEEVRRLITPRTKAIIAVDLLGHVCDYEALVDVGPPVIEDAAQAHGAHRWGRPAGSFGVMSIFSFHANKAVTTGEGGCVGTDDLVLASRVRLMTNHGMTPERPYYHDVVGRNLRMTNVSAAIGVGQVERWEELVASRVAAERLYRHLLESPAARFRTPRPDSQPSCWLTTVSVDDRDALVAHLRAGGIDSRAIWPSLPSLPLYEASAPRRCEVAWQVSQGTAWLPTWNGMAKEVVDEVADAVVAVLGTSSAVRS